MTSVPPKELEAVLKLDRHAPLKHLVKQVVGWLEIWAIQDDGWVLAGTKEGLEVFQVWPLEAYAQFCCVGEWQSCKPQAINTDEFVESFLPSFEENGIKVGIFYTPSDNGLLLEPGHISQLLNEGLDRI